jgi:hypothetical protein
MTRTFGERVAAKKPRQEPRVGRLNSLGGVACELARVYRAARHKKLETVEAYRLSCVLTALCKCLEASEIENRLARIEEVLLARERLFHPRIVS